MLIKIKALRVLSSQTEQLIKAILLCNSVEFASTTIGQNTLRQIGHLVEYDNWSNATVGRNEQLVQTHNTFFSYFNQIYVVYSQNNCLSEIVVLSTQNIY